MDDDFDISPAQFWKWFWITVSTVTIVTVAAWAIDVSTSGVRGKANVIKQNNNADNQIQAQDLFNKLWGDIQAYNKNIKADAAQVAKDDATGKDDTYDQSVLNAAESTCRDAVGQYNADTIDTTLKEWRPSTDPDHINIDTECEPPR